MMQVYIAVTVALIAFVLYALDRKFRSEPIDWLSAAKLTTVGGLLGGGITYAVSSPEAAVEAVKAALPEMAPVQEMFVGIPTF